MLVQICLLIKISFLWAPSNLSTTLDHPFFSLKWIAAGAGKSGLKALQQLYLQKILISLIGWHKKIEDSHRLSWLKKSIQDALVFSSSYLFTVILKRFPLLLPLQLYHCKALQMLIGSAAASDQNWNGKHNQSCEMSDISGYIVSDISV